MFNRYWREYPWFLQVILFGLMVFTFASFTVLICNILMPYATGHSLEYVLDKAASGNKAIVSASLWAQFATSLGIFLIPALLFVHQTHPNITRYLNLKKPGKPILWVWVLLMWAGALPLFLELGNVMKMANLGKSANETQSKMEDLYKVYLDMRSPGEFCKVLFIIALAPAVGEELFFRGVILRFTYQKWKRIVLSVLVSSLFFALAHNTPYNYLPIFIAGLLLCVTYYLTGSLLCGIAAHFFYNGSQVCFEYFGKNNDAFKSLAKMNHLPVWIVLSALVVFIVSLYMLWTNRTPLPYNWADDFTPEEQNERAQDATQL